MRHFLAVVAFVVTCLPGCAPAPPAPPPQTDIELYPPIEPFRTGYLKVSDLHEIYYELSGSPDGIPVFGLHGGPGGSSSPLQRRFTDPSRFLMVLHDQRGAGKSRPPGEIRENDTWALVEDIDRLRAELGLDKIVLFGGSWGTTLGLAYAEKYPEHVRAIVLRGVFLGRQEDIDHFYHGGSAIHFPDAYAAMLDSLPDPERRPLPDYFYELITNAEGDERRGYCAAWARYEGTLAFLRIDAATKRRIDSWAGGDEVCTFSLFENYYMKNHCFLEEGQLLRDVPRLAGIPVYIVQGRYDVICPPSTAWALHEALPGSALVFADAAGHSGSEPEIERALLAFFREIGTER